MYEAIKTCECFCLNYQMTGRNSRLLNFLSHVQAYMQIANTVICIQNNKFKKRHSLQLPFHSPYSWVEDMRLILTTKKYTEVRNLEPFLAHDLLLWSIFPKVLFYSVNTKVTLNGIKAFGEKGCV